MWRICGAGDGVAWRAEVMCGSRVEGFESQSNGKVVLVKRVSQYVREPKEGGLVLGGILRERNYAG